MNIYVHQDPKKKYIIDVLANREGRVLYNLLDKEGNIENQWKTMPSYKLDRDYLPA